MTIFLYTRLARNPEIENTTVWGLPNIWRLGWVRDTKFGTNVSSKMLLNTTKCQVYSFYRFWVIKEKRKGREGGGVKLPPTHTHTQIRVRVEMHLDIRVSTYFERVLWDYFSNILQVFLKYSFRKNYLF